MKHTILFLAACLFFCMSTELKAQTNDVGLSVSSVSHDKLLLNWQRVDQGSFTCEIQDCSGATIATVQNVNSYLLKDLTPNTEYGFKVKITTSEGVYYTPCREVRTMKKISFTKPQ